MMHDVYNIKLIYNIIYSILPKDIPYKRQNNNNSGITILIKGISALIPLKTVANNVINTPLYNNTSTCNERDC